MAGAYSQNKVYVDLVDRLVSEGGFKKMGENLRQFEKVGGRTKQTSRELSESFEKDLKNGFNEIQTVTTGVNKRGEEYIKTQTQMVKQGQRFNMNALGVMFAGMALNRTMSNLNATSREWVGMNELMSTAMGIVTLPTTMDLLNLGVLPLFDALVNLPEPAQKAIGYVTLALEGLGAVMFTGGQLMLGLEATTNMLKNFGGTSVLAGIDKAKGKLIDFGRYAGIGISIAFAVEDISEGDLIGVVSDAMMGAGFYFKNGWLLGAGIVLKMANEGWLQKVSVEFFDTIAYMAEWSSDTLVKALSLRTDEIDWSGLDDFFGKMDKYAAEKVLSGEAKSAALINRMGGVAGAYDTLVRQRNEELIELQNKYESGIIPSEEELNNQIDETNKKYNIVAKESLPAIQTEYDKILERGGSILENIGDIAIKMASIASFGSPTGALFSGAKSIFGSRAVGGEVSNTGFYRLHQGETVLRKDQQGMGGNLQVTYNVTVSDKREFEKMLRANNQELTSQVRRMSRV